MKEQEYIHCFNRFFTHEEAQHDRLKLIETYGIVSPKRARELGIPHLQETKIQIYGVLQEEYDDIIFLYPLSVAQKRPIPGNTHVFVAGEIDIKTPQQMRQVYEGWVESSAGEVYAFGQISTDHLKYE